MGAVIALILMRLRDIMRCCGDGEAMGTEMFIFWAESVFIAYLLYQYIGKLPDNLYRLGN